MIVNPDKIQAIVVKKNCRLKDSYALNVNNQTINFESCEPWVHERHFS